MKRKILFNLFLILSLALALTISLTHLPGIVSAQGPEPSGGVSAQAVLGSAFTYQGRLIKDGSPVTDTCDFQFSLWDAASDGSRIGNIQTVSGVTVDDGYFGVSLNGGGEFGDNAFIGDARYLQIATQCTGDSDFINLSGRVALYPTPYALFAKTIYRRTVVVSPIGTATENGAALLSALAGITDASATNPYLLKIEPGVYDLGTSGLTMKGYVDIEGSGELATKITAAGRASANTGTVVGADNAELRFLTVENTGGNDYATAIYNNSASPRLTHVTATASGALAGGQNHGILNHSASPTVTNTTVIAGSEGETREVQSYGIYNDASSPTMTNVTATALGVISGDTGPDCYGVYNRNNSSPTMTNVTVTGTGTTGYGVYNDASSPAMVDMIITAAGISGSGVHNTTSSPTMTNLTVKWEGTDGYGVYNGSSSPVMTNVIVTASGNIGYSVYNSSSSPTMTNVTIIADAVENYGVYNSASSPTMTNVAITAGGGGGAAYGIYNEAAGGSYIVKVNNSRITSDDNTIVNDTEFTTLVGASQLAGGGITGGGTVTCAGVYDESYTFYSSTCP